ncbi:MAG: hypothetical protein Q7W45_12475 [Bacteroidota bacterium]|nr:hypothetical protein [Bacteroidota bacterium]MDP3146856.1 hypothetical protein [Bacteroidota bacterium]
MIGFLIDVGIFSNLFYTGFIFFKEPLEFYFSYIPILILLPIFILKYKFFTPSLYIIIPLLIFGVFNILVGNNTTPRFLKIFLNISLNLVFYQYVIQYYNYDVKLVFKKYLNISFLVCALGLFQLFSYWIGFTYGYNLRLIMPLNKWGVNLGGLGIRINSIFSEPSSLGIAIAPAFFVSIYQLLLRTNDFISLKKCIVIVICYCFSFSSLAFLGIFFSIVLITLNFGAVRYFLLAIPISVFLFFTAYNNATEFKVRVDGIKELFVDNILDEAKAGENRPAKVKRIQSFLKRVHGSSFVFYNNYYIAKKNFIKNPIFGTGLGSHEFAYDKYTLNKLIGGIYQFNTGDANSLFLRTLSEIGLFGAVFLILFIFKYFVSYDLNGHEDNVYWVISNALLVLILLTYIRQGNYTYNGFFLYGWLYFYNLKNYKDYTESLS